MDSRKLRRHVEDICAASAYVDPEEGFGGGLEEYLSYSQARLDVVAGKFTALGYEPEFQDFPFYSRFGLNAVFRKGHKSSDEIWIVSHHDYCAGLGAEDNATGLAVMLAVAEYFKDSEIAEHLAFASFDLEERGLSGSRRYAEQASREELDGIRYLISLECLGSGKNLTVCTSVADFKVKSDPILVESLCSSASDLGLEVIASDYGYFSSDHESFAEKGVRVVELGSINFTRYARSLLRGNFEEKKRSGAFSNAHMPHDLPENLDYSQLADAAELLIEFIQREYGT